ncbi:MAG: type II toxin-antitoxin system VapC family toxin, partial [Proteobacteria bacterium]|nr:type II toxin-antitoxin system VapC family toxin [Pseudomonadota bacterium]
MRLLLDTHALLWWWLDDPQLSANARHAIAAPGNTVLVSAATAWELATKHRLGKLGEAGEAVGRFDELVSADGFQHLPINYHHCLKAGGYAIEHRDPFDRMLAAQTELEGLALVTR